MSVAGFRRQAQVLNSRELARIVRNWDHIERASVAANERIEGVPCLWPCRQDEGHRPGAARSRAWHGCPLDSTPTPSGLSPHSQSPRMEGAAQILTLKVISGQVEVLDEKRTVVGLAVDAQGISLDQGEMTGQHDSCRVEVPAHMEELDRPGSGLLPGALAHRSELRICRLELVTIRVPLVERFIRRHPT